MKLTKIKIRHTLKTYFKAGNFFQFKDEVDY